MKKCCLAFIFISILCGKLLAQQREWGIEVYPKAGFLLAHRAVMAHLPQEHVFGGEITAFIQTNGSKRFHQVYNYPKIGVSFVGTTIGNNELLGQMYAGYAFIDFPFRKNEKHEFSGRVGLGLSALTKVFDQHTNPKNVAMSSHLNAYVSLGIKYRYYFGKTHLVAGMELSHSSNGSSKVPNLGVNLPYLSVGAGYTFNKVQKIENLQEFNKQPWKFTLLGIVSAKEVFPTGGPKYPVYALSAMARKVFSPKSGIEIAYDLIYKTSIKDYKREVYTEDKSGWDITQMGIYCGYILPFEKLHFIVGMGAYLKDKYNPDDHFYHRLGLRYQANKHLLLNLTLKAHWAKADYIEYGIGYTF